MRLPAVAAAALVASAAPVATFEDTFTASGQSRTHAVRVAAGVSALELRLSWKKPVNHFRVTGIALATPTAHRTPSAVPAKLKITTLSRTSLSLSIRIEKLRPGTLRFRILATTVATAKAVCLTRVVQPGTT